MLKALEFYSGIGGEDLADRLSFCESNVVAIRLKLDSSRNSARHMVLPPLPTLSRTQLSAGMHFALKRACSNAKVVAAFEINELANDVYEANFGFRPRQVATVICTDQSLA